MKTENINQELKIELTDEVAQGSYANLAVITHSTSEFIFDFIRIMPGLKQLKVKERIIMTPEHAKRFFLALQENIKKYEAQFGPVKLPNKGVPPLPMPFGENTPQA